MRKLIIKCTIYLWFSEMVAKTQKNKYFSTLYKKTLNENVTLSFVEDNSHQDTTIWRAYIYNKKLKINVPIDVFKYNKKADRNSNKPKNIKKSVPFLINIVNAFLQNHTLYVIYSTWGVVRVVVYTFTEEDKFTKKTYLIGRFPIMGAYGKLNHFANFKLYDTKLFFYVQTGQQRDNTIHFLGYFDTTNEELYQYRFSKNPKKIKDTQQIGNKIDDDLSLTSSTTYNLMTESIQQLLVVENQIKQPNYFQYLFTIEGSNTGQLSNQRGMLYVFYKQEPYYGEIKVMQYFNGHRTSYWLLDDNCTRHIIEPLKIPAK